MKRVRAWRCLVLLWGLAAMGRAEESGALLLRTNGDFRSVHVADELQEFLSANEGLVGGVARRTVDFPAALATARRLARAAVPPESLTAALRALPDNETTTLRLLAFAQLTQGKPSAAFAVLVAALERDAASVDLLSDVAGLLAGFGYANESLAILDEIARRGQSPAPAMGISGRDALDYVRGYALARVGEKAGAKALLQGVAQREPLLAEAPRLLALLSDDPAEQRREFLLGVWRHRAAQMVCAGGDQGRPAPDQPEPDPAVEGEEVAIDVRTLIDPAKGKRGVQPLLTYAQTVNRANDLLEKLDRAKQAASDRDHAIMEERGRRPRGYEHTEESVEEVWGYRIQQLVGSIDYRDAKLRELDRRRHVLWREREDARRRIERARTKEVDRVTEAYLRECVAKKYNPSPAEIGEKARPAHEAAMAEFRPFINREELAEREWFAEWHYLATALAAQVGDPAWHEYIRLSIEAQRWRSYGRLLHLARMHASVGSHPMITKEPGEVPAEPVAVPPEKCDGNNSLSFGTSELPGGQTLPFEFGVEMTCEGMSVEAAVDTRIPGLSVSAEIGGDNQGNFTAFVGPKAEAVLGDKDIAGLVGSVKAGAYVTGNRNGVSDAGVKYEVKGSTKIGSFSGSRKFAEGNVSFFPAPAPSVAAAGPLAGRR